MKPILPSRLPIVQAPMAGAQGSALALAVHAAGGMGSLPCAMLSTEQMQIELTALRTHLALGLDALVPINVNFFCHQAPSADAARWHNWLTMLQAYLLAHGVDACGLSPVSGRQPFNAEAFAVLNAHRPAVVSFHFGLPDLHYVRAIQAWGGKVFSSATTPAEAVWLERQGVDAIIAQGLEAGGHRGMFLLPGDEPVAADSAFDGNSPALTQQLGLWALLPQVVKAVRCPVIAAGGIATASQVQAALHGGAVAAQVGTAYLLCPEAQTSAVHRAALVRATQDVHAAHTALTNLFTGRPARGLFNRLMHELGPLNPAAPAFPLAGNAIAPLRAAAEGAGLNDFSPLWAGQHASACQAIPAGDITRQLAGIQ